MSYNLEIAKNLFKKASDWLSSEYASLHTGRATPIVLDGINIESYGSYQPVKNLASINIEDPKTLRVVPWDKSHTKEIEKAIQVANIGLSVSTDDQGLRVIFPIQTEENRLKMVKVLKDKLEDARITIRKEREVVLSDMKDALLPEDEMFRTKDLLQKIVDDANNELLALFEKKEKDVIGE